jgi:hypothetical protein
MVCTKTQRGDVDNGDTPKLILKSLDIFRAENLFLTKKEVKMQVPIIIAKNKKAKNPHDFRVDVTMRVCLINNREVKV